MWLSRVTDALLLHCTKAPRLVWEGRFGILRSDDGRIVVTGPVSEGADRGQREDVVRFIRLPNNPDLPLPSRQTEGSAGYDVSSAEEDFELHPGERRAVSTGLRMALPPHLECQVRPRSGLALRHGLTLPNTPATIDPDYRGELKIILWNAGSEPITIRRGMRIAQLVFARFETPSVMEVEELGETSRGSGGFGSTGT
jgi:dUTP pyrophosphatase